jgi:predicted O-methyltransferase YrrM
VTEPDILALVRTAVERQLFGKRLDSYDIDQIGFLAAAVTSSAYAQQHMRGVPRHADDIALLRAALGLRRVPGLVLEFGVATARTTNFIAEQVGEPVYGFDGFAGLPEDWRPGFPRGVFASETLPPVRANVELVVGWFDRTLPAFLDAHPGPASFVHIDCDLYSSTQTVLAQLRERIVPGTVLVFDEYFNYPGWQMHEHRAFAEFVAATARRYEYVGLVPSHQQVAVRIVG